MRITPLKTPTVTAKFGTIETFLTQSVRQLPERSVLAITSKIVSILENRLVKGSFLNLVKKESEDQYVTHGNYILTLKNHRLIPNAGIDQSNIEPDHYLLYPLDPMKSAAHMWRFLKDKFHLTYLGILIVDSNLTPLRRGSVGIGLAWCGFSPLYDYRNTKDLFGRLLRVTQVNLLDNLASSAILEMGEGAESQPLALLEEIPRITFLNRTPTATERKMVEITLSEDIYGPLLSK